MPGAATSPWRARESGPFATSAPRGLRRPPQGDRQDADLRELTFAAPDLDAFPCLGLALQAAAEGGTAPAVLNAAIR